MHSFILPAINARFAGPHTICGSIIVSRTKSRVNHNAWRGSHIKFYVAHVIGKSHGPASTAGIGLRSNQLMSAALATGLNPQITVTWQWSHNGVWTLSGL